MRISLLVCLLLLGSSFSQPLTHPSIESSPLAITSLEEKVWAQIQDQVYDVQLPKKDVLELGVRGYMQLTEVNELEFGKLLAVIDFSIPSSQKRLWIIDVAEGKITHHGYVAHGRNSGDLMANNFSNRESSYMSSLGFYKTAETYQGKHGHSLRLDGLEQGFNDKARERAIVIHGAAYASEDFIKQTGRLGRSLGCPALPPSESKYLIEQLKEGALVFIYAEDSNYLASSKILNSTYVGI